MLFVEGTRFFDQLGLGSVLGIFMVADRVNEGDLFCIAIKRERKIGVGFGIKVGGSAAARKIVLINNIARKDVGIEGGGHARIEREVLGKLL